MALKTKAQLKVTFSDGKKPDGQDFADFIDSSVTGSGGGTAQLPPPVSKQVAEAGTAVEGYASPKGLTEHFEAREATLGQTNAASDVPVWMSPLRTLQSIQKFALGTVATSVNTLGKLYNFLRSYYYNRTQSDARYIQSGSGGGDVTAHAATSNEILVGTDTTKVVTPKGLSGATYVLKQNQLAFWPVTTTVGVTGGALVTLRLITGAVKLLTLNQGDKVMSLLLSASDSYGNKVEAVIDIFRDIHADRDGRVSISLQQNHGELKVKRAYLNDREGSFTVYEMDLILLIGTEQRIVTARKYDGNLEVKYLSGLLRTNIIAIEGRGSRIFNTAQAYDFNLLWNRSTTHDVEYETPFVVIDESKPTHLIGKTDGIIFTDLITTARVQRHFVHHITINFSLPVDLKVDDYITKRYTPTDLRRGYVQIATISTSDENKETFTVTLKWTAYGHLNGFGGYPGHIINSDEIVQHFPVNSDFVISKATPGKSQQEVGLLTEINPISSPTDAQKRDGVRSIDTIVTDRESGWPAKLSSHEQALHKGGIDLGAEAKLGSGTQNIMAANEQYNRVQYRSEISITSGLRSLALYLRFANQENEGTLPSVDTVDLNSTLAAYKITLFAREYAYQCHFYVTNSGRRLGLNVAGNRSYRATEDDEVLNNAGNPNWRTRITQQTNAGGFISTHPENNQRIGVGLFDATGLAKTNSIQIHKGNIEPVSIYNKYFGVFFGNAIALGQQYLAKSSDREGNPIYRGLLVAEEKTWLTSAETTYQNFGIFGIDSQYKMRIALEELYVRSDKYKLTFGGAVNAYSGTSVPTIGTING